MSVGRLSRRFVSLTVFVTSATSATLVIATPVFAQDPPAMGVPPPDAKALVEAPKAPSDVPKIDIPAEGLTVTLSTGGQSSSGNSRLVAATANGAFDWRREKNGVGAALVANYGRSAAPGADLQTTTENVQGRMRYDRFLRDDTSVFLIATGRRDRFQGLDFRLNLDPGAKYIAFQTLTQSFWVEGGYDFQYDIRRADSRTVLDANGAPVLDAGGRPQLLDKTESDHSVRAFAGYRHAFNKEVTLTTGVEFLQSFIEGERRRVNFDALFAAKVGGGLAVGLGFSARYDHSPLPGKRDTDTSGTASLIYAFSDVAAPAAVSCPPPEPPPPAMPPPPAPAVPPLPAPAAPPTAQ